MSLFSKSSPLAQCYRSIAIFTAIFFIFIAKASGNEFYTVETITNPKQESASHYVSDPASILSVDSVSYINEELSKLEKNTGIQGAVVLVTSIGKSDVFEFSQDLFRKWGIGRKSKDDGFLITYIEDQRVIRIHTGYGLERVLTDSICKRIQQQDMIPLFKEGKTDEGLIAGIDALCKKLYAYAKGDKGESSTNSETGNDDFKENAITIIATIVLILAITIGAVLKNFFEKCPNCGRRKTLKTIKEKVKNKQRRSYLKVTKCCSHCGYVVEHTYDLDDSNDDNYHGVTDKSKYTSSGGSFGGGSSGGGGANSRW